MTTFSYGVALNNSGTIDVESGSVGLNSGATLAAGSAITGPGQVAITAATASVNPAMSATNINIQGGTLTGGGDVTITGVMNWTRYAVWLWKHHHRLRHSLNIRGTSRPADRSIARRGR